MNTPDAITYLTVDIQYMWFFSLDVIEEKYYSFPLVKNFQNLFQNFIYNGRWKSLTLSFQERIIDLILYGNYCFP